MYLTVYTVKNEKELNPRLPIFNPSLQVPILGSIGVSSLTWRKITV
jgi:hypothetical protein